MNKALAFCLTLLALSPAQPFFRNDFEAEDAACWTARPQAGCNGWQSIRDAGLTLAQGEKAHSGKQAMKIRFAKNEDYAGTFRTVSTRHIFTRFYDYYDADFDFAAGMKIHRLSGFNAARQINDFDIILFSQAAGPGSNYCGRTEMQYLNLAFNGGPVDWGLVGGVLRMERGRWYCIDTEIKLNTPGSSDGEVRIWIDGRLFAEKRNMNLTGSVGSPINRVLFGGWYSNSSAGRNPCPDPAAASIRYVDDAAISDSYIGSIPVFLPGPSAGTRLATWNMPESGSCRVEYGATPAYGRTTAAENLPSAAHALLITGLDTNRVYHYNVNCAWKAGQSYSSGPMTFSTFPGAVPDIKRPKRAPVNLPRRDYDPIPD